MKRFFGLGLMLAIALQGCQGRTTGFSWKTTQPSARAAEASSQARSPKVIPVRLSPVSTAPSAVQPAKSPIQPVTSPSQTSPTPASPTPASPTPASPTPASPSANQAALGLKYETFNLPSSTVHLVRIPHDAEVKLTVALSTGLTPVSDLAQMVPGAMAAINAGFFDPNNTRSMNFITQNGKRTGDPTQNERLMKNAGIQPYLSKVLNRSEFRRYRCKDGSESYAINFHNDPIPKGCQLSDAVGGGPQLLPKITATEEAFWAEDNGQILRDAIGMKRPNARSAVALTAQGDILIAMVAQQPTPTATTPPDKTPDKKAATPAPKSTKSSGLSLPELATFLQGQGAVKALNLDGGSSSGLYFAPQTVYGKRDAAGVPIRRAVKSVLVVSPK